MTTVFIHDYFDYNNYLSFRRLLCITERRKSDISTSSIHVSKNNMRIYTYEPCAENIQFLEEQHNPTVAFDSCKQYAT